VEGLARGLAVSEGLPGSRDLTQTLGRQLRLARRAEAAHRLHRIADRLRFLYGIGSLPQRELGELAARCRTIWEGRGRLIDRAGAELEPEVEQRIRTDLLDLAILWADFRVRLASAGEATRARHEALRVLAEAEAVLAPSHVLYRERQVHAEALGLPYLARAAAHRAAEFPPRTAWEHYALGRALLRSGELAPAAAAFERALDLQPQGFWPNFYQGLCAYRLRRYEDAVGAFRACITLAPESAEVFHNRAMAYTALGQTDRALRDYDRALRLDPELTAAALNRGILHHREERHDEAIADLERALDAGADPAVVHYNLALVYLARRDRGAAQASLRLALQHNPEHREARILHDRLRGER
jgi:eukaryotic-like serine/threonine-protein kinase